MNQTQHRECFGTMFPDVLHVENDRQQRGKVFSLLLERAGGMIRCNREVAGDVSGQHCLIVDDLIDTAGTLVKAAEALLKQGAKSVRASATHAVLSGPAVERIDKSELIEVVVTNSIPMREEAEDCSRIKQLSVAPLLAKAIQSIHEDGSVSTLFV